MEKTLKASAEKCPHCESTYLDETREWNGELANGKPAPQLVTYECLSCERYFQQMEDGI